MKTRAKNRWMKWVLEEAAKVAEKTGNK